MLSNRLYIFDLDGTLLNTLGDLAAACDHVLLKHGYPTHSYQKYCSFVGNGIRRLVQQALPEDCQTPEAVEPIRQEFVAYYSENIDHKTHPYEGMVELLTELQQKGAKIAVASNKFHSGTVQLIAKFFPEIDFVEVTGNKEGAPLKPDPMIIEQIIHKASAKLSDTYMIGDSAVDMQTAHNAQIISVGVSWGFRSREELEQNTPNHIVDSVEELRDLLLAI